MDLKEIQGKSKFKKIDDYQTLETLGRGANGLVYKGLNTSTGSMVAIKQMLIGKSEMKSIKTQLNFLKKLDHPNIVKYVDAIQKQNRIYLILQYIEGGSLGNLVKRSTLEENVVKIYIKQILQGLGFLHKCGVIHRDIKGANILITKHGKVKLADFGVAVKIEESKKSISAAGSPYWIAPEIIVGECDPTIKCDIWSLGCTIIELLSGNPPYHDLMQFPALFRIVEDKHPPLPECSEQCRDFLLKCFQKQPQKRPDAKQLLDHVWFKSVTSEQTQKLTVNAQTTSQIRSYLHPHINYPELSKLLVRLPQQSLLYQHESFFNLMHNGEVIPNITLYAKLIKHNFDALKYLFGVGFLTSSFSAFLAIPPTKHDISEVLLLLGVIVQVALENQYLLGVLGECLRVLAYLLGVVEREEVHVLTLLSIIHRLFHEDSSIGVSGFCCMLHEKGMMKGIMLSKSKRDEAEDIQFLRIEITLKIYENWNHEAKYALAEPVINHYLTTINEDSNSRLTFGKILILSIMTEQPKLHPVLQRRGAIYYFTKYLQQKPNSDKKTTHMKILEMLLTLCDNPHRSVQLFRHGGIDALKASVDFFEADKTLQDNFIKLHNKVKTHNSIYCQS